jgi:hypothetical protein
MKSLLLSAFFAIASLAAAANTTMSDEYKVIFSAQKIWIMADETPVAKLVAQIRDNKGKVVVERTLTSKCSDWTLSVKDLSAGNYSLWLGGQHSTDFKL